MIPPIASSLDGVVLSGGPLSEVERDLASKGAHIERDDVGATPGMVSTPPYDDVESVALTRV